MFNLFKSVQNQLSPPLQIAEAPYASTGSKRAVWVKLCVKLDDCTSFAGFMACWMIQEYKAAPTVSKMQFIFERSIGEAYDYTTYSKLNKGYQVDLSVNSNFKGLLTGIANAVKMYTEGSSNRQSGRRSRGGTVLLPPNLFDPIERNLAKGGFDASGSVYWDTLATYLQRGKIQEGNDHGMLRQGLPSLSKELSAAGFDPTRLGL